MRVFPVRCKSNCLVVWMKYVQEGKLLARAGGFLSPWGSGSGQQAQLALR
jgi:hypothetical protein